MAKKKTIRVGILDTLIGAPDTDKENILHINVGELKKMSPLMEAKLKSPIVKSWADLKLELYLRDAIINLQDIEKHDFLNAVIDAVYTIRDIPI